MMLIIICSMIVALFIIIDLVPLYHKKDWKAFWVYTVLLGAAYTTHILFTLGIKVPSPADPIKALVSYIFGLKS